VGFPGIAALARRYGFTVYIDGPNIYGGMRAMVYVPEGLLAARPDNLESVTAPPISTPIEVAAAPAAVGSAHAAPAPVTLSAAPAAPVAEAEPLPAADPTPTGQSSTVHEITPGGLPRRRRRSVALPASARGPRTDTGQPHTDTGLPRVDIAEAWQTGSTSGRAAAHDNSEGMTS
jgi:hypothetical protein